MTDKKIYILTAAAAMLILLSAAIPIVLALIPTAALTPPMPPVHDTSVTGPVSVTDGKEEMRGLWIATVNNINFPSKQGLKRAALEKELDAIVNFASENGFNAILFQVRPAADALYKSEIFPASKVISGKCGKEADGGFDALLYITEAAHAKGIELHAWVNPLRVTTGNATYPQTDLEALPESSPARKMSEHVVAYADGKLYFDAGQPAVRELVARGVREICENYSVDGIIFDDYFYPYPSGNAEFDDAKTFAEYGGDMSLDDFRRESVNKLVELSYNAVKSVDSNIKFGVSPFGIWQNNDGENGGSATRGLEAYSSIYCDALAWARGGYVDYIAPQLYWSFDTAAAPFGELAEWWSRALDQTGVALYVNHGVYKYEDSTMQSGELTDQVNFSRELYSYRGGMFYGYAALEKNAGGVLDEIGTLFEKEITYFDYQSGGSLTLDSYKDGDTAGKTALISGMSNPAFPISVNGITPLRKRDGSYSVTLALKRGDNLITLINGNEKIEIILKY